MAVVLFCTLLGIRFVDFGYRIKDSLVNLGVVFLILLISPLLTHDINPFLAFVVHFISISLILIMTSQNPKMGNAGLYMFGYIFLCGNYVSGKSFINRAILTFIGFLLCGTILYIKHNHKNRDTDFLTVLKEFNMNDAKTLWQLRISLGMSILFLLSRLFNIEKFIWAGFACSSLLTTYPINVEGRLPERIIGVVIGSILFGIIYSIIPSSLISLAGPISGICLGLCATYRYKTILNCFGALTMATSIYGLTGAISLRIIDNIIGVIFGYVFFHIFQKIFVKSNKKLSFE